jgi:hypothetical protein
MKQKGLCVREQEVLPDLGLPVVGSITDDFTTGLQRAGFLSAEAGFFKASISSGVR